LIIRIPSAIDKLVELGITDNNRVGVFGQSARRQLRWPVERQL
jgi:hypothetical protein